MPVADYDRRAQVRLPVSAFLGDLEWRIDVTGTEAARRTVPTPQFLLFSVHSGYLQYHSVEDPAFRLFLRDLFQLRNEPNPFNRPTDYALTTALELSWGARSLVGARGWRNPDVDTDTDNGIRLTWNRGNREIVAVLPKTPDQHRYLYSHDQNHRRVTQNFETGSLAERLHWLVASDAPAL